MRRCTRRRSQPSVRRARRTSQKGVLVVSFFDADLLAPVWLDFRTAIAWDDNVVYATHRRTSQIVGVWPCKLGLGVSGTLCGGHIGEEEKL